jgi:hypothetical protein
VLRRFLLADENHRNVPTVALLYDRIGIYIHFAQGSAEFTQERRNGGFRFVAEVASGSRVESYVAGSGRSKAGVFGMSAHRLGSKLHLTGEQAPLGRTAHNDKVDVKQRLRRGGAKWEEWWR